MNYIHPIARGAFAHNARVLEAARDAEAHRVGDVTGLRLSPVALAYLIRMTRRELSHRLETLGSMKPHDGQSRAKFASAYAKVEARATFLQDTLAALEAAGVR